MKGFTLIEMVAAVTLMAIVGSLWGLGLANVGKGYLRVKENTRVVQKSGAAMMRMVKELQTLDECFAGTGLEVKYSRYTDPETAIPHEIRFDNTGNGTIYIDDGKLIEGVKNFSLTYYKTQNDTAPTPAPSDFSSIWLIEIEMEIPSYDDTVSTFRNMVYLRGKSGDLI